MSVALPFLYCSSKLLLTLYLMCKSWTPLKKICRDVLFEYCRAVVPISWAVRPVKSGYLVVEF